MLESPTEEGWYWHRDKDKGQAWSYIAHVYTGSDGQLWLYFGHSGCAHPQRLSTLGPSEWSRILPPSQP